VGRNIGPQCRLCRTEGTRLFLKGERCRSAKCPITKKKAAPGKATGGRARIKKQSDYAMQLREKQRLKRMYGMLEAQFHLFFERATQAKGVTGEVLIQSLERRMDNVVYRMHFAPSRKAARQLVLHGHVRLNGRTASVPSQLVKANDMLSISERSAKLTGVMESLKEYSRSGIVPWLEVDPDKMTGTVKAIPRRSEVTDLADIREQLIVELYSK
jgi:small subunit ribosomal protein S4